MSGFEPDRYIPLIDAILGASDLEVISAKRIRRGIQELLNVDLDSYKKDMDAVIMDRFLRFQQSVKQAEKVKKKSKSTMDDALQNVESDEMVAARLHSELNHRSIRESSMRRSRATKKATRKKSDKPQSEKRRQAAENNPFNEKLNLSNDLQNIVGEAQLTRPHVVKALWAYIKEHSLQNPDDKREILCDDLLKPIFGEKTTMFRMNKQLKPHLFRSDEVVSNPNKSHKVSETRSIHNGTGLKVEDPDPGAKISNIDVDDIKDSNGHQSAPVSARVDESRHEMASDENLDQQDKEDDEEDERQFIPSSQRDYESSEASEEE